MFPVSGADFEALNAAVERLTLNDASVEVKRENSAALGAGFRCGYALLVTLLVTPQSYPPVFVFLWCPSCCYRRLVSAQVLSETVLIDAVLAFDAVHCSANSLFPCGAQVTVVHALFLPKNCLLGQMLS